jgi:hypothetical protein
VPPERERYATRDITINANYYNYFNIFYFNNTPINKGLRSDHTIFYLKQYKALQKSSKYKLLFFIE